MTKVEYYTKLIEFSQKRQQVMIVFKRLATKEQLEKWDADQKDRGNNPPPPMQGMITVNMIRLFENPEPELQLNFDRVNMIVTLREAHALGLKIGDMVLLDIPEEANDIQIQKVKN